MLSVWYQICDIRVALLHAAFAADTTWGVLLEPAGNVLLNGIPGILDTWYLVRQYFYRALWTNLAGARLAVIAYPAHVVIAKLPFFADRSPSPTVARVRGELVRRSPQDTHLRFDHLVLHVPEAAVTPVCKMGTRQWSRYRSAIEGYIIWGTWHETCLFWYFTRGRYSGTPRLRDLVLAVCLIRSMFM